jgi:hypothetical protein
MPGPEQLAPVDRSDGQIIEGCDRVSLGPKPDASGRKSFVPLIDEKFIVQPAFDAILLRTDAQRVPLAKRRSLDPSTRNLMAAALR